MIYIFLLLTLLSGTACASKTKTILKRIGCVGDPASADTIFGILGDADEILGESISAAINGLEEGQNGTFTAIAAIVAGSCDLNGVFTAINTGFNGTFTAIAAVVAGSCDLSGVFTAVATGFNGTFTALAACCAANTTNANGTFTAIAALQTSVNNGFNGTFTAVATGFNGTFTAIAASQALVLSAVNTGFNGTFTAVATGFNGTFTALAACCAADTANFNGTFTAIAALQTSVNNGFNGTFTAIATGFNGTFTAVATGFNGTFTTLRSILDIISSNTCCSSSSAAASACGIIELNTTPAATGQTITITAPGYYQLCETVTFQQIAGTTRSIIQILANDVTLDMNAQSIISGSAVAFVNGIELTGTSNITIKNGTIDGLSGTGIVANFSAVAGGGSDIAIQNVTVNKSFMGFYANTVGDLNLNGASAYKSTSTGAMIISTTSFTVINSQFNSSGQDGLAMTGVNIGLIENSIARFNATMGFYIGVSSAKTTFQNNRAFGNTLDGFRNDSSNSTLFGNLSFGNTTNYAGSGPVGFVVIGNGGQPNPDILIAEGLTNVSIV